MSLTHNMQFVHYSVVFMKIVNFVGENFFAENWVHI